MTEINERLTELLMQSYDQGVSDAKAIAEAVVNEVVAKAVEAEREACAKSCESAYDAQSPICGCEMPLICADAIRARGEQYARLTLNKESK